MGILKDFITLVEGEGDSVDIRELFTDDNERLRWEKMVEVFEHIQIDRINEGLKTVSTKYNLSRDEQVDILAYLKFLELMVIKMDAFKQEDAKARVSSYSPSHSSYDGSMYN